MDQERPRPWSEVWEEYTQDTSLHGLRYTTLNNRPAFSRILWWVLVSVAIFAFLLLSATRIKYLREYSTAVDIEVTYKDELPFPAVTICNQNTFRLSKVFDLAMFNVFDAQWSPRRSNVTDTAPDSLQYAGQGCLRPDRSQNIPYAIQVNKVSLKVCHSICRKQFSGICSMVVYGVRVQQCIITQPGAMAGHMIPHPVVGEGCHVVLIYSRVWKEEGQSFHVTFESGDLETTGAFNMSETDPWSTVEAMYSVPNVDHTTLTGAGHYLYLLETDRRPGQGSALQSGVMWTHGQCLSVYYQLLGTSPGTLTVHTEDLNLNVSVLFTSKPMSRPSQQWQRALVGLPSDANILVLTAIRAHSGRSGFALDDIKVDNCSIFNEACLRDILGKEYTGPHNMTLSGLPCLPWLGRSLPQWTLHFVPGYTLTNECRNPDGDPDGPWCYFGDQEEQRETCGVPLCECSTDHMRCYHGPCLPRHLVCDGTKHCPQGDDEGDETCRNLHSVSCSFSDPFLCGYKLEEGSPVLWTRYQESETPPKNPFKNMEIFGSGQDGQRSSLLSPWFNMDTESHQLEFYFKAPPAPHPSLEVSNLQVLLWDYRAPVPHLSLWESRYQSYTHWVQVRAMLPQEENKVRLVFRGTMGSNIQSYLYIANISVVTPYNTSTHHEGHYRDFPLITAVPKGTPPGESSVNCTFGASICGYTVQASHRHYDWKMDWSQDEINTPQREIFTTSGKKCVFPSRYNGRTIRECQPFSIGYKLWCPTTDDYDWDNEWGTCLPPPGSVATQEAFCVFPFTFKGTTYTECTRDYYSLSWCSCTSEYSGTWDYCNNEACGGYHLSMFGTITSPNFPRNYGNYQRCYHVIKQPEGTTIKLVFDNFWLESQIGCSADVLEIRDGGTPVSPLLRRMCGQLRPEPLTSSTNNLWLYFKTDRMTTRRGFKITYSVERVSETHDKVIQVHKEMPILNTALEASLASPPFTLQGPSCLTLHYSLNSHLNISLWSCDDTSGRLLLTADVTSGLEKHELSLDVTAEEYGDMYQFLFVVHHRETWEKRLDLLIDDISFHQTPCTVNDSSVSVECDFSKMDLCGYQDVSSGATRWLRTSTDGNFFMIVSDNFETDVPPILLSPAFDVSVNSCIIAHANVNFSNAKLNLVFVSEDLQEVVSDTYAIHIGRLEAPVPLNINIRLQLIPTQKDTVALYDVDLTTGSCPSSDVLWTDVVVKTIEGIPCVFPFVYKGRLQGACQADSNHSPWCSTTENYDRDGKWGICALERFNILTVDGSPCVFPSQYNGRYHLRCLYINDTHYCPLSDQQGTNQQLGECDLDPERLVPKGDDGAVVIKTVGGTGGGRPCVLPYIEGGEVRTSCITTPGTRDKAWCSTTVDYDADNQWGYCKLDDFTVMTDAGRPCVFPYKYNDELWYTCIGRNVWCSLTSDYDRDRQYDFCTLDPGSLEPADTDRKAVTITTTGGTVGVATCHFPFMYNGELHTACVGGNSDTGAAWCATTHNYDKHNKWGYCVLSKFQVLTVGGDRCVFPFTYKDTKYDTCIGNAYLWCATAAVYSYFDWGKCELDPMKLELVSDNGTDADAGDGVTGAPPVTTSGADTTIYTTSGSPCVFPFTYQGATFWECITLDKESPWCGNETNVVDVQWGFCDLARYTVHTVGGTADGGTCSFPFIHGGHVYSSCVSHGGDISWCATSPNMDTQSLWGYCLLGLGDLRQGKESNSGRRDGQPPVNSPTFYDFIDTTRTDENVYANISLEEFATVAGHQRKDMILTCRFEGETCPTVNIESSLTDLGLCHTFNYDVHHPLYTRQTGLTKSPGAQSGLQVTLNLEQYEYLHSANTDAGFKVYLHPPGDVALVRDLGFALPPGAHSRTATKLNKMQSLGPPYGTCGVQRKASESLWFVDNDKENNKDKSFPSCLRQCEREELSRRCNCTNFYMTPGEGERWCEVEEFLTCVTDLYASTKGRSFNCGCPDACSVDSYDYDLSASHLSDLSVETLLSGGTLPVQRSLQKATEIRNRVDHDRFEDTFNMMVKMTVELEKMKGLLNETLSAHLSQVGIGIHAILNMADKDFNHLRETIKKYKSIYHLFFGLRQDLLRMYGKDFQQALMKVILLIDNGKVSETKPYFSEMVNITKDLETVLYNEPLTSHKYTNLPDIELLPSHQWNSKAGLSACTEQKSRLKAFVSSFHNVSLEFAQSVEEGNPSGYDMRGNLSVMVQMADHMNSCRTDYEKMIEELLNLCNKLQVQMELIRKKMAHIKDTYTNTIVSHLASVSTGQHHLNDVIASHVSYDVEKHELAKKMLESRGLLRATQIKQTITSLENEVIWPMGSLLREASATIRGAYRGALEMIAVGTQYFDSIDFTDVIANFKLWQKPKAEMITPEVLTYTHTAAVTWRALDPSGTLGEIIISGLLERRVLSSVVVYFDTLEGVLNSTDLCMWSGQSRFDIAASSLENNLKLFEQSINVDGSFIRANFLRLDIFFAVLRYEAITQMPAYDLSSFFSEIGGYMGLLIGASVLTLFEALDTILYNVMLKCYYHKKQKTVAPTTVEKLDLSIVPMTPNKVDAMASIA